MIRGSKVSADDPLLPIHDEAMEQIIAATYKATKRMTNGTGDKPK